LIKSYLDARLNSTLLDEQPTFGSFAKDFILAKGGWTEALGLRSAMEDYFVNNRLGYAFPGAISIFRNLAWGLLILEMWSNPYRVAPDVG
jgi:hypothetical protein